jgi:pantoate--beta-alanine ligase
MIVTQTIADCRAARSKLGRVALVPTMGALHAGHVRLMEIAHEHAESVAVSIFVNPTQFGPREDFSKYPRPIEKDLELCRGAGVDLVFNPQAAEMYPANPPPQIVVDLPELAGVLEGRHRPGHFRGVCQVVGKLFNIIQPQAALFGQKDFQQLRILTAMTQELNWPITIVPCPTMRDPDGLAISSRNQYLSAAERKRALDISRGLFAAQAEFDRGVRDAKRLVEIVQNTLTGQQSDVPVAIDYVAAADAITLQSIETVTAPAVLAVAARVGTTRLIDNVILKP